MFTIIDYKSSKNTKFLTINNNLWVLALFIIALS